MAVVTESVTLRPDTPPSQGSSSGATMYSKDG
jgi:hypothetical protein